MGNSNCDAIDALGGIINSTGNGDVAGVLGSLADACRIGEDNRRDRYDHDRERYDRRQEYYREQHEYRQYQQEEVNDIIRRVQDMYPEEIECHSFCQFRSFQASFLW